MPGKKFTAPPPDKIKIKKDDQVKVITGRDKGKTGRVISVDRRTGKVLIEGVSMIKRHTRPNPGKQIKGGIADCALAVGFEKMEMGSLGMKYTDRTPAMDKHMARMFEIRDPEASPFAPQMFGNAGRDHMEKYGSKPEHYAWIGWKNHKHSVNNPYAQFQTEYTLDEIKTWVPKITDALQNVNELNDVNTDQQDKGLEIDINLQLASRAVDDTKACAGPLNSSSRVSDQKANVP